MLCSELDCNMASVTKTHFGFISNGIGNLTVVAWKAIYRCTDSAARGIVQYVSGKAEQGVGCRISAQTKQAPLKMVWNFHIYFGCSKMVLCVIEYKKTAAVMNRCVVFSICFDSTL